MNLRLRSVFKVMQFAKIICIVRDKSRFQAKILIRDLKLDEKRFIVILYSRSE